MGLALRAVGSGIRVFIAQFVKGRHYGELDALARFGDLVTVRQYGRRCFIRAEPEPADIEAARQGLEQVRDIIAAGEHPLVILDEANIAVYFHLFSPDELLEVISARPPHVEIVVTGRYAPPQLLEAADLITEMKEIRHYYNRGIQARRGIEM